MTASQAKQDTAGVAAAARAARLKHRADRASGALAATGRCLDGRPDTSARQQPGSGHRPCARLSVAVALPAVQRCHAAGGAVWPVARRVIGLRPGAGPARSCPPDRPSRCGRGLRGGRRPARAARRIGRARAGAPFRGALHAGSAGTLDTVAATGALRARPVGGDAVPVHAVEPAYWQVCVAAAQPAKPSRWAVQAAVACSTLVAGRRPRRWCTAHRSATGLRCTRSR